MLKLPENWKDQSIEDRRKYAITCTMVGRRTKNLPPIEVVELEITERAKRIKKANWASTRETRRFFQLAKSPLHTYEEIADIMNVEFGKTTYNKLVLIGKMNRLRALAQKLGLWSPKPR